MFSSYHTRVSNRREFIKKLSVISAGSACVTISLLQSCSTIDEYLITDPSNLENRVIIVGGGIVGLYAAYQLKKRKVPYRIFEASHRLGGQILSEQKIEYGAFDFSNTDLTLLNLINELQLKTEKLDSKSWSLKDGGQSLISILQDRIASILPEQQLRFNCKLMSLENSGNKFKLNFATPGSDKAYYSSKIILAIPVQDVLKINGLDLNFKLEDCADYRYLRVVIPVQKINSKSKLAKVNILSVSGITASLRVLKNTVHITFQGFASEWTLPEQIESLDRWIAENIFSQATLGLQSDQVYIWNQKQFKSGNSIVKPQKIKNRVIVSDGSGTSQSKIENLLLQVNQQIDEFL